MSKSIAAVFLALSCQLVYPCPYFSSDEWLAKAPSFSEYRAPAECLSKFTSYTQLTYEEAKPKVVGSEICTQNMALLIGPYVCAERCAAQCDHYTSAPLSSINCLTPRAKGESDAVWQCICTYTNYGMCVVDEMLWSETEAQYTTSCLAASSSGSTAGGTSSVTTTATAIDSTANTASTTAAATTTVPSASATAMETTTAAGTGTQTTGTAGTAGSSTAAATATTNSGTSATTAAATAGATTTGTAGTTATGGTTTAAGAASSTTGSTTAATATTT